MISALPNIFAKQIAPILLCGASLLLFSLSSSRLHAQIITEPDRLDFGTIALGTEAIDSITVFNIGLTSVLILNANLLRQVPFGVRSLTEVTLPSSASVPVRITFEPTEEGCFEDTLVITWEQFSLRVPVMGCAVDLREVKPARFVFEGGQGGVGDTMTSRLHMVLDSLTVAPPLQLDFSIHFSPDALWPLQVRASDGIALISSSLSPASGRIEGRLKLPEGPPITFERLILEVDWIGLSTGEPINEVGVVLRYPSQVPEAHVDTSLVSTLLLDGCTVDSPPFTGRIAARSVRVDPERGVLQVDLVMPQTGNPAFSIVDVEGRRMPAGELSREPVTGPDNEPEEMTRIRLDLVPIPRGIHALEVRLGSDRIIIPFLRP